MFVLSCIAPFVGTGALGQNKAKAMPAIGRGVSQSLTGQLQMFEMQGFGKTHASPADQQLAYPRSAPTSLCD
jgi:hypothetical protein